MTPQDENKPVDPAGMPEEWVEPTAQGGEGADGGDGVDAVADEQAMEETAWGEVEVGEAVGQTDGGTVDEESTDSVVSEAAVEPESDESSTGVPPVYAASDEEEEVVDGESYFDVANTGGTPVLQEASAPVAMAAAAAGARPRHLLSGGWTMGLVLSGIGLIAACVLIPMGDQTRRLMYEREKLRMDLEHVQKQVATNEEFLKKVQEDPTLAQRLAQRQMKLVPAGTQVLDADVSPTKDDKSPFLIVSVPPPAPLAPYQEKGGWFADMCRNGRSQLYMIGGGLMLVAAGLVLGASGPRD